MRQKEIGIYVHIPFCKKKCSYCDFYSCENMNEWIPRYIKCLIQEIKQMKQENTIVKTIYIGGGTPSSLTLKELEYLFKILKQIKKSKNLEFTIEVNCTFTGIIYIISFNNVGTAYFNLLSSECEAFIFSRFVISVVYSCVLLSILVLSAFLAVI